MNSRQGKPRGVVLIAALGLALVLGIVVRGVMRQNPTLVAHRGQTRQAALEAAKSGVEYAKSRLSQDPAWKAGGSREVVVDSPALTVVEDHGNVIGLVTLSDGGKARFRLRFNYQDGSGGPDGQDDPSLTIPMTELSYNNILSPAAVVVPEADPQSFVATIPDGEAQSISLPGRAVLLAVRGEAGVGLSSLTSGSPNAAPVGFVQTETVRTVMKAEVDIPSGDAVVMAGGGMEMTVAQGQEVQLLAADGAPRLRTKKGIKVESSNGHGSTGDGDIRFDGSTSRIGMDESLGMTGRMVGDNAPTIANEHVGDGVDFYNLPWDQVRKADSAPLSSESVQLPAGIYFLADNDRVEYYDMPLEEFQEICDDKGYPDKDKITKVITSQNFKEVRTIENLDRNPDGLEFTTDPVRLGGIIDPPPPANPKLGNEIQSVDSADPILGTKGVLSITKDLCVVPSDKTGDFAIINPDLTTQDRVMRWGLQPLQNDDAPPPVNDGPPKLAVLVNIENSTISCGGSMKLQSGNLQLEEATLTGPGQLLFQTMDLRSSAGQNNLSVYFKGDVKLSSWNGHHYGALALAGTLYSQSDIIVKAGDPEVKSQLWGNFSIDGNIVAYGGDPAEANPGATGGKFQLTARKAGLQFDPTSVAGLFSLEEGLPEAVTLSSSSFFVSR